MGRRSPSCVEGGQAVEWAHPPGLQQDEVWEKDLEAGLVLPPSGTMFGPPDTTRFRKAEWLR